MKDLQNNKSLFFQIRGYQVMLDTDLAKMYHVETKKLNQAVRRNRERFPREFMFQLTEDEYESLKPQIETEKEGRSGRRHRYLPFAFTEHGILMLSSVLNSKKAMYINSLCL